MAQLTEQEILNYVYELREGDDTHWETTDSEYVVGRSYCNMGIGRWEFYDNSDWNELWASTTDSSASDATLTITAGTYDYACPSNMRHPGSYVRTVSSGISTYYKVLPVTKRPELDDNTDRWCYFTGSVKDGFYLHFNPELTLTTGDTIAYEYYKQATKFSATTSKSEMDDPFFLVYFVLSRFYETDGEDGLASKAFQESEDRLETMRVRNMSNTLNMYNPLDEVLDTNVGFGVNSDD